MNIKDIIRQYFPDPSPYSFHSEREQLDAWLSFLDLCSAVLIAQIEDEPQTAVSRMGSLLSYLDLSVVLAPSLADFGKTEQKESREAMWELYQTLIYKGLSEQGSPLFPLSRLLSCNLRYVEQLAVLMALSSALFRKYERIYGILQEEKEDVVRPTVGLCIDYGRLFLPEDEVSVSPFFSQASFLNSCLLLEGPKRFDSELSRPLALRPVVLSYILGEKDALGSLERCARIIAPLGADAFVLRKEELGELRDVAASVYMAGSIGFLEGSFKTPEKRLKVFAEITGEEGSGKEFLANSVADSLGARLLSVDMTLFFDMDAEARRFGVKDIIFVCSLYGCMAYLKNIPPRASEDGSLFSVASGILPSLGIVMAGTQEPLSQVFSKGLYAAVYRLKLYACTPSDQKSLWEAMAKEMGLFFSGELSMDEIVSKYTMNPGRIYEVLSNVRPYGKLIERRVLEEQIRRSCMASFGKNATRLVSPFTWDDLMIDEKSSELLRYAADRVRYRKKVYEDFGFGAKLPYGRGVAIVLYGPPGTGKTMAAQVLSAELGLELYRIDLSMISSKYIGETEKNLGAVFSAAKNSNAILFFDEADALFSKRTSVESSHDKYANAETSYLLQKIEEYDGVSILATNNMQNFDAAFKRRMTYLIPIEAPTESTRLKLWEKVFPPGAPIAKEVDFKLLAQAIELTGSAIKSAALFAAFLAASEDREIEYRDFVTAVDLECQKTGQLGMGQKLQSAILMGYQE